MATSCGLTLPPPFLPSRLQLMLSFEVYPILVGACFIYYSIKFNPSQCSGTCNASPPCGPCWRGAVFVQPSSLTARRQRSAFARDFTAPSLCVCLSLYAASPCCTARLCSSESRSQSQRLVSLWPWVCWVHGAARLRNRWPCVRLPMPPLS